MSAGHETSAAIRASRILLVGPLPEPKGGVSIHVARLRSALRSLNYEVKVLDEGRELKQGIPNLRRLDIIAYVQMLVWAAYVHVHTSNPWIRLGHVLLARLFGSVVLLTVHSSRERGMAFFASLASVRLAHRPIYVSQAIADRLGSTGDVIPAFLPPENSELSLSAACAKWIDEQRSRGKIVVVSNASHFAIHNGEDLYGLDNIIEVFEDPDISKKFSCLFVVASVDGREDYLAECCERVRGAGLGREFLILNRTENFAGICARADMVLRATNTDGDSVSVREALHIGKIVVASDCAQRPQGVYVFATRRVDDLKRVMIEASLGRGDAQEYRSTSVLDLYRNAVPSVAARRREKGQAL